MARELAYVTAPKPKRCWSNSVYALLAHRLRCHGKAENCFYVEGWLLVGNGAVAIEHGWLEIDNQIVDVTLIDQYPSEMYYPVHRHAYEEAARRLGRDVLPFHDNRDEERKKMNAVFAELPCNQGLVGLLTNLLVRST